MHHQPSRASNPYHGGMSGVSPCRLVALISGRGSNLQAILDGVSGGVLAAEIAAVISNEPDAPGLSRAAACGVATRVVAHRGRSRAAFEAELTGVLNDLAPDLVVLAGFMRVLGGEFVAAFQGRMLNIHPSLLPDYRGLHTHTRVLADGCREHGVSVHFVTPELDGGPLIAQVRVPVLPGDDPDTLAARVLRQEHRLYPLVVDWFARGRLRLRGEQVWLDGLPLARAIVFDGDDPCAGTHP